MEFKRSDAVNYAELAKALCKSAIKEADVEFFNTEWFNSCILPLYQKAYVVDAEELKKQAKESAQKKRDEKRERLMSKYENFMNKAQKAREMAAAETNTDMRIFFLNVAEGLEKKARALTIEEAEAE